MNLRTMIVAAGLALLPLSVVAVELDGDGLHRADWIMDTFRDLREDLDEANAMGKRLVVMIEQRGCIYCTQMHEEVYVIPEIEQMLTDDFFVVRVNMYGSTEMVDFDGTTLWEGDMVRRWRVMFTPTILFFPEDVPEGATAPDAAVAMIPGAFGRWTTFNMLNWVLEKGYESEEGFQAYHARMLRDQLPQ
ncbi:SoxW family protein [Roseobacter sp. HKCCD5988]|jgi:thioredoxin-related protein|uniref:SoxW family protein n=1 Tax=Roseobacter sp. HKCCD5988 TaxID=3120338 RepID=UPI0030EC3525